MNSKSKGYIRRKFTARRSRGLKKVLFECYGYHKCFYCGVELNEENATIDHIVPLSKLQSDSNQIDNLVLACSDCNNKKGNGVWYCPSVNRLINAVLFGNFTII
jgi:5-methylcytosine-specific restriction endonuclease McrA